jgi:glycosyltransferase involved in cell wall biosynthesis
MRITLISLHFAEYACRLAESLALNNDVQLILSEPNVALELEDDIEQYYSIPNLTIVKLPHSKSPLLFIQNVVRLVKEVKYFNPSVIHQQNNRWDYEFLAMLYLSWIFPYVLTVHDPQPHSGEDSQQHKFSRHRFYQWILRGLCDGAITHGILLSEQLIFVSPWLVGRVTNIQHGPLGTTKTLESKASETGVLLFFGRINAYKGLRYFIDAVLQLRAKGIPVKGLIAGRGGDLASNRDLIDSNDCFELHDEFVTRTNVNIFFTRAQLIIMPYIDATQSGVAAMAFGFGRPVVATKVGAIPEMVLDGYTGLLVPPRDSIALADAIESLLKDPVRYSRLSDNIRKEISNGILSWEHIALATVKVYKKAIAYRKLK